MITQCLNCNSDLADPIINDKGRLRPLKKPYRACPNVACGRIVNTITGEMYLNNKLTEK